MPEPASTSPAEPKSPALSPWWLAIAGVILVELAVATWLRPNDSQWDSTPTLQFSPRQQEKNIPIGQHTFQFIDQSERLDSIAKQLSFTEGICGLFAPPNLPPRASTPTVELFYFEYAAGNPLFFEDVLGHAPEVCMKASGATLKAIHPTRSLSLGEQTLSVRVLEFTTPTHKAPLWVYRLTWLPEDSPYEAASDAAMLRKERILGGMLGNPRPPARTILAGARNFTDEPSAWNAFRTLIGNQLSLQLPAEASNE